MAPNLARPGGDPNGATERIYGPLRGWYAIRPGTRTEVCERRRRDASTPVGLLDLALAKTLRSSGPPGRGKENRLEDPTDLTPTLWSRWQGGRGGKNLPQTIGEGFPRGKTLSKQFAKVSVATRADRIRWSGEVPKQDSGRRKRGSSASKAVEARRKTFRKKFRKVSEAMSEKPIRSLPVPAEKKNLGAKMSQGFPRRKPSAFTELATPGPGQRRPGTRRKSRGRVRRGAKWLEKLFAC